MTQTIIAEQQKTTENYAVFESAEVGGQQDLTGMYVSLAAFDGEPFDFIEVRIDDDGPVTLNKQKDTTNFGVYESESGAISGMYVSHDILDSDEGEAPENRGISIAPATEDDFEDSQTDEELEDEAGSLLADAGDDDDAVEVTSEEEAEDLLAEAEEA